MLCVKRNDAGDIEAAIEVRLVNDKGDLDPQGRWAWVEQVEVNPCLNSQRLFRYFMEYFAKWMPTAQWCYWVRRDSRTPSKLHMYSRKQVELFVQRSEKVMV